MSKVYSERSLARMLGMTHTQLGDMVGAGDTMYSPFVDTSGSKPRTIDRPLPALRQVQRKIYDLLLKNYPYSEFAVGGIPKRSLREAAEPHVNRSLVVQVDVKSFYPSISDKAVFSVWRRLGHGTDVSRLLTRLTTYNHHVPQGASTSMALANIFMEPVDMKIFSTLRMAFDDVRYTRWVDDLFFSGKLDPAAVFAVTARCLREVGLRAHRSREKRRVMPSDACQSVLGMVVNTGLSFSRKRKRLTRAIVHTANTFGGDPASVKGHIQHLRTLHGSLADQLEDSLRLAPVLFRSVRR